MSITADWLCLCIYKTFAPKTCPALELDIIIDTIIPSWLLGVQVFLFYLA